MLIEKKPVPVPAGKKIKPSMERLDWVRLPSFKTIPPFTKLVFKSFLLPLQTEFNTGYLKEHRHDPL